ncbi:MAG: TSUP family transporter [Candidatus Eisenbacteria bacterium]|uniref:Probable membrane transporter protein n=1 Tax=Eiseniibacteriota bacterium TaxID=2212470 RepID=A0A948RTI9_UNCEI|nr:TSUP family transporter [Candidatus Eisenbacteria bacterium]MBU1948793.1 TSUP family transporter [Candidatus Eisenbacteria bacterium]MBU2689293.1 TSUP family transporter [Candidatus Eisenbacteria bacterium]
MNFNILYILGIAVVIFLASAIQSAVGFAFALFAAPLLIWMGMPLPHVIATMAVCSFLQSVLGASRLRASVPWKSSLVATATRTVMVGVGLLALRSIVSWDPMVIKMIVGFILCVLVGIQMIGRKPPVESVHWIWGGLAFSSSGILAGVSGMGGPPLVLWSLAHNWSAEKTRGFLFAVFATSIPVQLALLYIAFGPDILHSVLLALLLTPAVFLGASIGMPIGNRMSKPALRKIINIILLIIGLASIIPAVIHGVWG